jgi:hypothetical protein
MLFRIGPKRLPEYTEMHVSSFQDYFEVNETSLYLLLV